MYVCRDVEYLNERLACVCQERDALKREVEFLKKDREALREVIERQLRMNRSCAVMAMELDRITGERDALQRRIGEAQDG